MDASGDGAEWRSALGEGLGGGRVEELSLDCRELSLLRVTFVTCRHGVISFWDVAEGDGRDGLLCDRVCGREEVGGPFATVGRSPAICIFLVGIFFFERYSTYRGI